MRPIKQAPTVVALKWSASAAHSAATATATDRLPAVNEVILRQFELLGRLRDDQPVPVPGGRLKSHPPVEAEQGPPVAGVAPAHSITQWVGASVARPMMQMR